MKKIAVTAIKTVVKQNEFVIIYCYSKQCQVCKTFTPLLEETLLPKSDIPAVFYKLNLQDKRQNQEQLKAFADNVHLDSIPFMAVFNQGKFIGADNFSSEEGFRKLESMIKMFKERQNVKLT